MNPMIAARVNLLSKRARDNVSTEQFYRNSFSQSTPVPGTHYDVCDLTSEG